MIKRDLYLNKILPLIDLDLIKVITGIRRSGKSVMLTFIMEELKNRGVKDSDIIYINFESEQYQNITNKEELNNLILNLTKEKTNRQYLFFDEIQKVSSWEISINGFMVDLNCDIYITGSNSNLLSGELATYLTGRYMEIKIYPFSFKEILQLYNEEKTETYNEKELFQDYINYGGMPVIFEMNQNYKLKYLEDLLNSILYKDIMNRYKINNPDLLDRLLRFIIKNVGHTFSANSISKYFKNEGRKVLPKTIYNYLIYCENACLIHRVYREDLIGKKILRFNEKFFITDQGFRQSLNMNNTKDISQILENIVYMEMLRRGYKITIGKIHDKEIDFICRKNDEKIYIQVSYLLTTKQIRNREFGELLKINDNYPKIVISMDEFDFSQEGIKHYNIINFLKN
jgi:predicted AAA+ superfamily ATPase